MTVTVLTVFEVISADSLATALPMASISRPRLPSVAAAVTTPTDWGGPPKGLVPRPPPRGPPLFGPPAPGPPGLGPSALAAPRFGLPPLPPVGADAVEPEHAARASSNAPVS